MLLQAGCPGDGDTPHPTVDGRQLYLEHCARCHGESGDGRGSEAAALAPRPRAFSSGVFKFLSTHGMPSDDDLLETITRGLQGTPMPSFAHLPLDIRRALAGEVKALAVARLPVESVPAARKRFGQSLRGLVRVEGKLFARVDLFAFRGGPGKPVQVPPAPRSTPAQVALGEEVYLGLGGCTSCHGAEGQGDGPLALGLKDDWDQPIRPTDFTRGVYKRGDSPRELYLRLTLGIPGTPMAAVTLSDEQQWALVHYLRGLGLTKK